MTTYSVELGGIPISIPVQIQATDLMEVMKFVDKLRIQYPAQNIVIFENFKQLIDY